MDAFTSFAFIAFWIALGLIAIATATGVWAGVRHRRKIHH